MQVLRRMSGGPATVSPVNEAMAGAFGVEAELYRQPEGSPVSPGVLCYSSGPPPPPPCFLERMQPSGPLLHQPEGSLHGASWGRVFAG